jgi:hypothetical protein
MPERQPGRHGEKPIFYRIDAFELQGVIFVDGHRHFAPPNRSARIGGGPPASRKPITG